MVACSSAVAADPLHNWPAWRGPLANGTSPTATPPLEWSETKAVRWKAKIPGVGTSTPIVWENQVFILTAIPLESGAAKAEPAAEAQGGGGRRGGGSALKPHNFDVISLDRATGKILWQKTAVSTAPHEGHHQDHGFASASPTTDGQHLIAYFGSRGLHCFDLQGKSLWSKQFGQMQTRNSFGEGASATLSGNRVFVIWDHEGSDDFIAALDKATGKELWRTSREEATGWATPLVVDYGGKTQVIINATGRVRSYDAETGKELWQAGGQTANAIPTPVADQETVYVTSGYRGSACQAIALGNTGDLTGSKAIRWTYDKQTPYVPSPLLSGDFLYFTAVNNPVLTCLDAKTGQPHYAGERVEGLSGVYASMVEAKDRVYLLGRDGNCVVFKKGPKFEVLAKNKIDDKTDASIALAGRDLFIRGHQYLYCIGE